MRQMAQLSSFRPQSLAELRNQQVNAFATPLLVNVTGPQRGMFVTVGCYIASANFASLASALDVSVSYAIDGMVSPLSVPIFEYDGTAAKNVWHRQTKAGAVSIGGDGSAQGDFIVLMFGLVFQYAAIIIPTFNAAPDMGNPRLMHFVCFFTLAPNA